MEYQKIINLLENTPNRLSKFSTRNWVEINDESNGTYGTGNLIRFKTSMIKSSLCYYSDAYIHVKGIIRIPNTTEADAATNNSHKKVISKICVPFIICISEINNTQVVNDHDIDVIMSMFNLIEYSDIYSET